MYDNVKTSETLEESRARWERLAKKMDVQAIIGKPMEMEEFFETGMASALELDAIMHLMGCRGQDSHNNILDFGCGIGRVSKALMDWFVNVVGVDISDDMIAKAHANVPKATFVRCDDLSILMDDHFDVVWTQFVLQHCPQAVQYARIEDFFRITKPGGLVTFDVLIGKDEPGPRWGVIEGHDYFAVLMYSASERSVDKIVAEYGGDVTKIYRDNKSFCRYAVLKPTKKEGS
jgi:ubiquinone/menaquinone biosynthesis C-methylase UbiE